MTAATETDRALVDRVAKGDRAAVRLLFMRHHARIYRFVTRQTGSEMMADDIANEVFLELWKQAPGFEGRSEVSTWLLGIARFKALSSLPKETDATWKLIQQGGPFPYPKNDGVVFHNNGNVLPRNKDGYYHEYTVDTPGAKNRATRRLITGSQRELYYTDDHYDSFAVVDPTR